MNNISINNSGIEDRVSGNSGKVYTLKFKKGVSNNNCTPAIFSFDDLVSIGNGIFSLIYIGTNHPFIKDNSVIFQIIGTEEFHYENNIIQLNLKNPNVLGIIHEAIHAIYDALSVPENGHYIDHSNLDFAEQNEIPTEILNLLNVYNEGSSGLLLDLKTRLFIDEHLNSQAPRISYGDYFFPINFKKVYSETIEYIKYYKSLNGEGGLKNLFFVIALNNTYFLTRDCTNLLKSCTGSTYSSFIKKSSFQNDLGFVTNPKYLAFFQKFFFLKFSDEFEFISKDISFKIEKDNYVERNVQFVTNTFLRNLLFISKDLSYKWLHKRVSSLITKISE